MNKKQLQIFVFFVKKEYICTDIFVSTYYNI